MNFNIDMKYIVIAGILVLVNFIILYFYTLPPQQIKGSDISKILSISSVKGHAKWSKEELKIWNRLHFEKEESVHAGGRPDYITRLMTEENTFQARYNIGDSIVFFNFIPEIEYTMFQKPPHNNWDLPLYTSQATDTLLQLLQMGN